MENMLINCHICLFTMIKQAHKMSFQLAGTFLYVTNTSDYQIE